MKTYWLKKVLSARNTRMSSTWQLFLFQAEEITISTDLIGLQRPPTGPKGVKHWIIIPWLRHPLWTPIKSIPDHHYISEIGDLLNLFVFAAEKYPPGLNAAERQVFAPTRKEILKAMLKSGWVVLMYIFSDQFHDMTYRCWTVNPI